MLVSAKLQCNHSIANAIDCNRVNDARTKIAYIFQTNCKHLQEGFHVIFGQSRASSVNTEEVTDTSIQLYLQL